MIEIEINRKNLELFISDIRKQDKEEMFFFYGDNYKEKFISTVLNNKNGTYFLSYNSKPSCIGGIYKDKIGGQLWLLCTDCYNKFFLYKYLKAKIERFKKDNDFLYNYVYKTNFKALIWLSRLGFEVNNLNNPDLKLFYYKRRKP